MKICTKCKTAKDYSSFPKRSKSKDGLAPWCTQCYTEHARNKYASSQEERERKKKNQAALVQKTREYIYEYLGTHPCVTCGESDPIVLEFDHRDIKEKESNVSELMKYSLSKIKKEVAKCDVMCANCHRRKTAKQFNTWKTIYGV